MKLDGQGSLQSREDEDSNNEAVGILAEMSRETRTSGGRTYAEGDSSSDGEDNTTSPATSPMLSSIFARGRRRAERAKRKAQWQLLSTTSKTKKPKAESIDSTTTTPQATHTQGKQEQEGQPSGSQDDQELDPVQQEILHGGKTRRNSGQPPNKKKVMMVKKEKKKKKKKKKKSKVKARKAKTYTLEMSAGGNGSWNEEERDHCFLLFSKHGRRYDLIAAEMEKSLRSVRVHINHLLAKMKNSGEPLPEAVSVLFVSFG